MLDASKIEKMWTNLFQTYEDYKFSYVQNTAFACSIYRLDGYFEVSPAWFEWGKKHFKFHRKWPRALGIRVVQNHSLEGISIVFIETGVKEPAAMERIVRII